MKIPIETEQKVIIIGGGIAGLAAAWYLQQDDVQYTLLESNDRFGGLIYTKYEQDCAVEFGPDAFITRKPWARDLVREIGLDDELIAVNDTPERIYVLADGKLALLPAGLRLLVPTDIGAFLASPLMSLPGKLRALMDMFVPPREEDSDESLADFIIRRMGQEALDKIADPLLAGVYNADMHEQSILATFPQYRALEKEHGSLIRGMLAREEAAQARTTDTETPAAPALVSFKGGMSQFINTLASKLTGDVRLNCPVERIEPHKTGYRAIMQDGLIVEGDSIIVATPSNIAAKLLETVAPESAVGLSQIRHAGIGSLSLLYDADDVELPLDAYGVVIPSSAARMIDGMQWSSSKWVNRAPEGKALIRVFFGGPHTRYMLDKSDDELLAIVREEVRAILGITAKPQMTQLGKWENAYPQYDVGHIERIAAIESTLPPTIALAGKAYHGVGIPDTVRTAKNAAKKLQQQAVT